jgi:YVTN family beta-propeller protein
VRTSTSCNCLYDFIDTSSNKIIKAIATGAGAHNVTFSPDGKLAYIANLGTNSITIIDAATKEILADVLTDTKAHDVAVSPDGKIAVSCNVGAGNITFIDVASKKASLPSGLKVTLCAPAPVAIVFMILLE